MSLKAADFYLFQPRDWNKTQITKDIKGKHVVSEHYLLLYFQEKILVFSLLALNFVLFSNVVFVMRECTLIGAFNYRWSNGCPC